MFEWFEKLKARPRNPGEVEGEPPPPGPSRNESTGQIHAEGKSGAGNPENRVSEPENLTSVPIMTEILKLLGRIEYGLDEQQIASSLEISAEATLVNCQALEQEMFIHHHDDLAQWFIAQRGLEFLQLPENLS